MVIRNSISKETTLLIAVLFDKTTINDRDFAGVNYEKLTYILSQHLVLPTFFVKLRDKNYLNYVPDDFRKYIKSIYEINKERNKTLINEMKEISLLLNTNGINHVFTKGSANLANNLYDDIGERMIGDIDILVSIKDYERAFEITKEYGYLPNDKFIVLSKIRKHFSRQTNKKKLFSIEIHNRLYDNNIAINKTATILKNKVKSNKIYTPCNNHQFINNILNFQINDKGGLKLNYSFKSFYDTKQYLEKYHIEINNLKNYYFKLYFSIANMLNIHGFESINYEISTITILRMKLRLNSKVYRLCEDKIIDFWVRASYYPQEIIEFIKDAEYRKYIISKFKLK